MKLTVSEVSKLTGVSIRTLHYYDEIGLLKPCEISQAGYRYYGDSEIETLQQILFYRELELSLSEIGEIMSSPKYSKSQALEKHKKLLEIKRRHIDELLELVDKTIGGKIMNKNDIKTSAELEATRKQYAVEARQKWGETKEYSQSQEKYLSADENTKLEEARDADDIFDAFAMAVGKEPSNDDVQKLVKRWHEHINKYNYDCSKQILSCLGMMYVSDERFTENLNKHGDGTAQLMSDAIKIYCEN